VLTEAIARAEAGQGLTRDELAALLCDPGCDAAVAAAADRVRARCVGDEVHLRGLVEFTNRCAQNCLYCGLRRDNRAVERYRLTPAQVVELATKAASYGYRTVVLQSGEGNFYAREELCDALRAIRALGLAVTLSVGEKSRAEYEAYRAAGADRYLLRIETTDRRLYEAMSPGMSLENRVRCLRDLKDLGYELGTGCLVGLPGQTVESLADDVLFFRDVGADMVGIGPFIPNPQTPLGGAAGGSFALALKVMALARLVLRDVNIPATTAMETLDPEGRVKALQAGANVVMPNVTEGEYRRLYALYPGKICVDDTPARCRSCITGKIEGIGRTVSTSHGFRVSGPRGAPPAPPPPAKRSAFRILTG
jgi:biotin synthase